MRRKSMDVVVRGKGRVILMRHTFAWSQAVAAKTLKGACRSCSFKKSTTNAASYVWDRVRRCCKPDERVLSRCWKTLCTITSASCSSWTASTWQGNNPAGIGDHPKGKKRVRIIDVGAVE